ncbi:Lipid A deacylase PagL [wastewater metagenome]|uniref:Lipid A deacylase PagL n=2 Tax=unclassified sequences TaxID=12908 RepID=A0A5B8R8R0_9ZZZZ|nr:MULTISPECIES: acyloxyacyl hydrolase [Arhodomonas]MCS4504195.1 acyloxyacyl hydrolase [Arhodomonas aquaeolei]QEA04911.1 lipid A deacylase PagL [uncultured organism]
MTMALRAALITAALATAAPSVTCAAGGDAPHPASTSVGVRAGSGDNVDSVTLYLRRGAPWVQRHIVDAYLPEGVNAHWEAMASHWGGSGDDTHLAALGPVLTYQWPGQPILLSTGVQPSVLSDSTAAGHDLGGHMQFTSHIAVGWRPLPAFHVAVRAQHTSNADLYEENPGVDIVSLELAYHF